MGKVCLLLAMVGPAASHIDGSSEAPITAANNY